MKPKTMYHETAHLFSDEIRCDDSNIEYMEGPHINVHLTGYDQYNDVVVLEYTVSDGTNRPILQGRYLLRPFIGNGEAVRKAIYLFDDLMIEHGIGLFGQGNFAKWNETSHAVIFAMG